MYHSENIDLRARNLIICHQTKYSRVYTIRILYSNKITRTNIVVKYSDKV